jgi:hypothetical protein
MMCYGVSLHWLLEKLFIHMLFLEPTCDGQYGYRVLSVKSFFLNITIKIFIDVRRYCAAPMGCGCGAYQASGCCSHWLICVCVCVYVSRSPVKGVQVVKHAIPIANSCPHWHPFHTLGLSSTTLWDSRGWLPRRRAQGGSNEALYLGYWTPWPQLGGCSTN